MSCITVNSEQPKPTTFEDLGYVQVVRCKDCKYGYVYYDGDEPNGVVCDGVWHGDYWFCADGTRK